MKITDLETGLRVTCTIGWAEITDAKVYVDDKEGKVYICQDILDGAISPELLGYKRSWIVKCKPDSDDLDFERFYITDFKIVKEEEKMIKITDLETGTPIACKIDGEEITDAKVYVDLAGKLIYICQDLQRGNDSPDLLGYRYSWEVKCIPDSDDLDFEGEDVTNFKIVALSKKEIVEPVKQEIIEPVKQEEQRYNFKIGDKIMVWNGKGAPIDRIFVFATPEKYYCIYKEYEKEFAEGLEFKVRPWENAAPAKPIKINGRDVFLTDAGLEDLKEQIERLG
jgi:hypothetical protein